MLPFPITDMFKVLAKEGNVREMRKILEGIKEYNEKGTNNFTVNYKVGKFKKSFSFKNQHLVIDPGLAIFEGAERGQLSVLQLMDEFGYDITQKERKNNTDMTALHYAMQSGNEELCKYLIGKGLSVYGKCSYGCKALDYAKTEDLAKSMEEFQKAHENPPPAEEPKVECSRLLNFISNNASRMAVAFVAICMAIFEYRTDFRISRAFFARFEAALGHTGRQL